LWVQVGHCADNRESVAIDPERTLGTDAARKV
jgi:hypothetical protein